MNLEFWCSHHQRIKPAGIRKLKLQFFGHLIVKNQFTGEDPGDGKDWGQEDKKVTEGQKVGWHHWLHGHEFEQTLGDSENREAWRAAVPGVVKSQTWPRDGTAAKAGVIKSPVSHISDTWEKCSCALTVSSLGSGVGFSSTPETRRGYHPLTKQERLHTPLITSRNAEPLWSLSVSLLHSCPLHRASPHLFRLNSCVNFWEQTFWKESGGHSRWEDSLLQGRLWDVARTLITVIS